MSTFFESAENQETVTCPPTRLDLEEDDKANTEISK
jgi:hypothetical protein